MAPHIGERIRTARLDYGKRRGKDLSQEELAQLAGVRHNTISRAERGETKPNATTLEAIARVLQVSSDWLLGLSEDCATGHGEGQTHNDCWRAAWRYLERFTMQLV